MLIHRRTVADIGRVDVDADVSGAAPTPGGCLRSPIGLNRMSAPGNILYPLAGLALARTRRNVWAAVNATLRHQSGRYSPRFRF